MVVNSAGAKFPPPGCNSLLIFTQIDFGTHVNGNIIDSAFTVAFDESFDPFIKATKEATNTGLKMAGRTTHLCTRI